MKAVCLVGLKAVQMVEWSDAHWAAQKVEWKAVRLADNWVV